MAVCATWVRDGEMHVRTARGERVVGVASVLMGVWRATEIGRFVRARASSGNLNRRQGGFCAGEGGGGGGAGAAWGAGDGESRGLDGVERARRAEAGPASAGHGRVRRMVAGVRDR